MQYDVILSVILYAYSAFFLFFGMYGIISNVKNLTNRLFLYLTLSMAIWSFGLSIAISAPTEESCGFWLSFTVLGRGVFFSLLLHFIILLTKTPAPFKNKRLFISLIYLAPVVNIILFGPFGIFAKELHKLIPTKFGWIHIMQLQWANIYLTLYYLTFTLIAVYLVIRWWIKLESGTVLKRYGTYFLIAVLLSLCAGFGLDILPDIIGKGLYPKVSILVLILPIFVLFLALKNAGLILERSKSVFVFPRSDTDLNSDRIRVFHVTAILFMVGAVATFMIGYFGIKRPLEYELILLGLLFSTGIFLLFIPAITKKHFIQDTLFLAICTLSAIFLMATNTHNGAVTIWAAYIVFLLITVVLNSKYHALIFTILCILLEVIFWIFIPEINVTIDGNAYVTRILIVFLSYFAIRYLTNEYSSKMKGYLNFAKEQETLEKISTSFISVDNENARDKIDEMFQLSAEVLDFDIGYLIEFNHDYEEALVFSAYKKNGISEKLGTKFNPNIIPMLKTIITEKKSIGWADTTSLSADEDKEAREFFLSREALSYYALPLIIEDNVFGLLLIEHHKKLDINVWENQINFLGVLANMLADSKKKIMYEAKLYDYAYFDELTQLANRNMMINKLTQNIQNLKGQDKLAVLYIEIENLRMINDTFGHTVGDNIIKRVASILKNLSQEACCISRIEKRAFSIVIHNVKSTEQVEDFIDKINDAFSIPINPSEGRKLFITTAIGVSIYPDDGKDAETLIQNADLAGYEAKQSDNKVVFFSNQLTNRIAENIILTNRLFTALENNEFSLEFQPQINGKTGKTAGVEALLRWNYEANKRIRPDIFIPILEQTGLIHEVGLWVLEQSLKEHNNLISKGFAPLRFSINISIIQFRDDDFVSETINLIKKYKVDPKYVELEITETLLSVNFEDTVAKLEKLKAFGVSIAIDDFGKGYSSLHRLEIVPFNRIKIDKSIVDDIISKNKKTVIVQTIVALAKSLMADTTAEGVETKEQLDFLVDMDCDEIQGYYYSKPLPIEALETFLKNE